MREDDSEDLPVTLDHFQHISGPFYHGTTAVLNAGDELRAGSPRRSLLVMGPGPTVPLLLYTDYGGGPLWYPSADNTASSGIDLSSFNLSEDLHDRLVRWTAADYHLDDDYEDDDPEHEAAWHREGLALLADLRVQLGPGYDIKFAHDLDA